MRWEDAHELGGHDLLGGDRSLFENILLGSEEKHENFHQDGHHIL
jgi:hypothetical protein